MMLMFEGINSNTKEYKRSTRGVLSVIQRSINSYPTLSYCPYKMTTDAPSYFNINNYCNNRYYTNPPEFAVYQYITTVIVTF